MASDNDFSADHAADGHQAPLRGAGREVEAAHQREGRGDHQVPDGAARSARVDRGPRPVLVGHRGRDRPPEGRQRACHPRLPAEDRPVERAHQGAQPARLMAEGGKAAAAGGGFFKKCPAQASRRAGSSERAKEPEPTHPCAPTRRAFSAPRHPRRSVPAPPVRIHARPGPPWTGPESRPGAARRASPKTASAPRPRGRAARREPAASRPPDREVEEERLDAVEHGVDELVEVGNRRDAPGPRAATARTSGRAGRDPRRPRPSRATAARAGRDAVHDEGPPEARPDFAMALRLRAWMAGAGRALLRGRLGRRASPSRPWAPAPCAGARRASPRLPSPSPPSGLLLAHGLDAAAGGAARAVGQRLLARRLLLGLELEVHELEDRRLGGVALAGAEAQDARVAARTVDEPRRERLEDALDGRAVRDPARDVAARREVVGLGAS